MELRIPVGYTCWSVYCSYGLDSWVVLYCWRSHLWHVVQSHLELSPSLNSVNLSIQTCIWENQELEKKTNQISMMYKFAP